MNATHPQRQRAVQQRATDKIARLLDATIEALERDGEDGVRVAEICREVDVAYGTVYHHFGDRAGLIRAAQLERLQRQPGVDIEAFRSALTGQPDAEDFVVQLLEICRNIASPARGDVRLIRTSVIAGAQNDDTLRDEVTRLETEVMTNLVNVIDGAKQLGIADPSLDSLALATYLSAVSYGLVLAEVNERKPDVDALAEVILRGFAAFMPA